MAAPVPSDFRTADGNTFVTLFFPAGVLTGDITGTFTEQLQVVTHSDGSQNVYGNATCTCAVAGRTGVLVFDNIAGTTSTSGVGNAALVLDVFDAQGWLVAGGAQRAHDLADLVVDLLRLGLLPAGCEARAGMTGSGAAVATAAFAAY